MKDSSKVIMGATLVMVVSLAIVLGLVLVLLVELYCSLLLHRRRRLPSTSSNATINTVCPSSQALQAQNGSLPSPLSSIYAQGVLHAPRSSIFAALSPKQYNDRSTKLHTVVQISNLSRGLMSSSPSPSTSLVSSPPHRIQLQAFSTTNNEQQQLMYISNPIYDNSRLMSRTDTPFETPDTSPSRLETETDGGSSGEDEITAKAKAASSSSATPPLTPMKKLPAEARSVSLRDTRSSLGTSGSDSVTISNNGLSSSSSGSPCTSPSW